MDSASHRPLPVSLLPSSPGGAPPGLLLAADVGGTHARLAVLAASTGAPMQLLHYGVYRGAHFTGLPAIIDTFIASLGELRIDASRIAGAVIACAGYVLGDAVINDNLPWPLPLAAVRERLPVARLMVINDFEALAHGLALVDTGQARTLIDGAATPAPTQPMVVMGPGTGLGCAVWLPASASVLTTEAGQIAFAPGTAREARIREVLAAQHEYVAVEQYLSGPGLLKVYRALAQLDGASATLASPEAVTAAGLDGSDALARETIEIFAGVLGGFCADLAMLYGALGGIYLAGGFVPQLYPFLLQSTLPERFHARGVMRPWLAQVPVRVIEHGQLGVLGAARRFCQTHALSSENP